MSGAFMYALFWALVALNILDTALTWLVLKRGGRELNPLLNRLFKRVSPAVAMVAIKAAGLAVIYALLPLTPMLAIQVLIAAYAALVAWNSYQLIR